MAQYYLDGEEKFNAPLSLLYYLLVKVPNIQKFYDFVISDIKGYRGTLMDVGTGPGDIPIRLAKQGKLEKIYAVDPSKSMLCIARHRSGAKKVSFALGSSRSIPFKIKFNLIISCLSFHHWIEKEKSLCYLKNLLKNDGEIRIYEYNSDRLRDPLRAIIPSHALRKEEVAKIAAKSGLRIAGVSERETFLRVTLKKKQ